MAGERWLSADEQRAWRRLGAVMQRLPASLDGQLQRDADLSHFGYWVLAMLSEAPGRSLRMSELASRAHGSQSRLSHLVAGLEGRGWIRRQRAAEDGRGNVAVLTEAGYAKIVESAPGHVAQVRKLVFDALTPAQVDQLDGICTAILGQLDAGDDRPGADPC
ncbi:MAG TPA: MarR family transcriptional regulator [Pilimelia sp.]|nr:MarR family transcriptional regulator [Pilimelia sp.]